MSGFQIMSKVCEGATSEGYPRLDRKPARARKRVYVMRFCGATLSSAANPSATAIE